VQACFIGGASAYGGIGIVPGTIIGGPVMGIMNNEMSLLRGGIYWQQGSKGLVLLVAFDFYNKKKLHKLFNIKKEGYFFVRLKAVGKVSTAFLRARPPIVP
jgi:hypothetical protein